MRFFFPIRRMVRFRVDSEAHLVPVSAYRQTNAALPGYPGCVTRRERVEMLP